MYSTFTLPNGTDNHPLADLEKKFFTKQKSSNWSLDRLSSKSTWWNCSINVFNRFFSISRTLSLSLVLFFDNQIFWCSSFVFCRTDALVVSLSLSLVTLDVKQMSSAAKIDVFEEFKQKNLDFFLKEKKLFLSLLKIDLLKMFVFSILCDIIKTELQMQNANF